MSASDIRILIVIPVYNNAATIADVARRAMQTGYPVLVVDDGCTDGGIEKLRVTSNELQSDNPPLSPLVRGVREDSPCPRPFTEEGWGEGLIITGFEQNRGKGAAIMEGNRWAMEHGFTHILTIDADGQHHPEEIPQFVEAATRSPLSIVIGTRDFNSDDVPGSSKFGRKFSNFWIRVCTGQSVSDSQSGYRVYPCEALELLKIKGRRYNFEVEVIVRAIWAGLEISEVPIKVEYADRVTHFHPFKDNARISWTYTRLVLRNFLPLPHKLLFGKKRENQFKLYLTNPWKTLKMLFTERLAPSELALAVGTGVFLATFPLIGFHGVAIVFVATRIKVNRLVALSMNHFCGPPFVPALSILIGYYVRNGRFLTEFTWETLGHQILQRLGDYIVGSAVLAPFLAIASGLSIMGATWLYQKITRRGSNV